MVVKTTLRVFSQTQHCTEKLLSSSTREAGFGGGGVDDFGLRFS